MRSVRQLFLVGSLLCVLGGLCSGASIEKPITWNVPQEMLPNLQLAALPPLLEPPPPTLQSLVTAKLEFPLIQVPEPAAYLLIGLGLIVVSAIRPRKHAAR